MRISGIKGVIRRRSVHTTVSDPKAPRFANLVERAWGKVTAPDQCWVADFTYIHTRNGVCYTAFVTDVYTREILSFVTDITAKSSLVVRALQQAISAAYRRDPTFSSIGVIHHSDAGVQYTSWNLRQLLSTHEMNGSIGTVGDAYDNGLIESAIGLYKTELIYFKNRIWDRWQDVEAATADWVYWYNHHRLHSSINDIPPNRMPSRILQTKQQRCIKQALSKNQTSSETYQASKTRV